MKAAIRQIREKEYAAKYAMSGKRVTLVGLAFSKKRHTIVSSAIEPLWHGKRQGRGWT